MAFASAIAASANADDGPTPSELAQLSIEDLSKIVVSSVSKTSEPLSDAPAAIYVITHDDIVRSGALSIPEMLRLAPNLEVAQVNATTYSISARGFNGSSPFGPDSNKLLVLVDGRTVYTPLYSGVYWDTPEVPIEDIDRIEVISGPGGTLWGANAVNGVINVITRKSSDTQGGVANAGGGSKEDAGNLQYGGRLNKNLTYRVYGAGFQVGSNVGAAGQNADDRWHKSQGGFRFDWAPPSDLVTVQGDSYEGSEEQLAAENQEIAGENLTTRWNHKFDGGSALQVQAYFDDARRFTEGAAAGFALNTYDLDVQYSAVLNSWNNVVLGGGDRVNVFKIEDVPALRFVPANQTMELGNLFVEDTMSFTDTLKFIPGIKLEWEPYVGMEPLPSARLSWKATDTDLLWAAVSRGVRSPTPFDRNLVVPLTGLPVPFFIGGPNFRSETLVAYELGYRAQPTSNTSISISTFDDRYDNLRTTETAPGGGFFGFPLQFGNLMEGSVYGAEIWGNYRVVDWWRLSAGLNVQHENLRFKPGSAQLNGIQQAGDDPNHQASLRSSMDILSNVTLDVDLREVGALPNPAVSSYVEMNSRVGWAVTKALQLSVSGFNLIRSQHIEFINGGTPVEIGRSFFANARVTF